MYHIKEGIHICKTTLKETVENLRKTDGRNSTGDLRKYLSCINITTLKDSEIFNLPKLNAALSFCSVEWDLPLPLQGEIQYFYIWRLDNFNEQL